MPSRQIRLNLINDYIDRTAADVMSANPGMFDDVSQVPEYLYLSLKTLWLGAGAASGDFAKKVVADLGTGMESSAGCITIFTTQIEDQADDNTTFQDDRYGAEVATVEIYMTIPRVNTDIDLLMNAGLRIKYLLDYNARILRGLTTNLLVSPAVDNSILSPQHGSGTRYFIMRYLGLTRSSSIRVSDQRLHFKAEYSRAFGR